MLQIQNSDEEAILGDKVAKYRLEIKYDGSKFYGWAKQPGLITVQGELERTLNTKVLSAGRTDRYVHAKRQVIAFKTKNKLNKKEIYNLVLKINQIEGLKVIKFSRVFDDFEPLYDATGKVYEYFIDTKNKSKEDPHIFKYGRSINIKKVRKASELLIGTMNFSSFTGKKTYQNYERTITDIKISKKGRKVKFTIKGKGFMRFMVRNLVGALLAYDRGRYTFKEFKDLLDNPEKGKAHYKAPGSGLYLKKIEYRKLKK